MRREVGPSRGSTDAAGRWCSRLSRAATALYTEVLNLIVAIVLTPILNAIGGGQQDETVPADYRA